MSQITSIRPNAIVVGQIARTGNAVGQFPAVVLGHAAQIARSICDVPDDHPIVNTLSLRDRATEVEPQIFKQLRSVGFTADDASRQACLAAIQSVGFTIPTNDQECVERAMNLMCGASLEDFPTARESLIDVVEQANNSAFLVELEGAVERAFGRLEMAITERVATNSDRSRMVGLSSTGEALDIEILPDDEGNPTVIAEPRDVKWPDCDTLLDDFETSLRTEVVFSAPVRREPVRSAAIEAARKFIKSANPKSHSRERAKLRRQQRAPTQKVQRR